MKKLRKILLNLMAVVMVLGTCMTAQAASANSTVKSIAIQRQNGKGTSSVTIYTNKDTDDKTLNVSFTWDQKTVDAGVTVSTNNRGVVKATLENLNTTVKSTSKKGVVTKETKGTLKLEAVGNGTATITIQDKFSKKKKTLKVTVKTLAEDIKFDSKNVTVKNNGTEESPEMVYEIEVAQNGKLNLGASVFAYADSVSNKGVKYKVVPSSKTIKVDSKGNVTVKGISTGVISVTSADGNVSKNVNVTVIAPKVTNVNVKTDVKSGSTPGLLTSKKTLALKGNESSDAHTYQLRFTLNDGATAEDLTFASSNERVAKVDGKGKITAVANGSANITVAPAKGNGKAVKISVKVTTDPEVISVAKKEFEIIANGKDTAKIGAATNSTASNKTVKYEIVSVKPADQSQKAETLKDMKKYITLDSKGNVKAKKSCTALIRAYSSAIPSVDKTVTIVAAVPVNSITLAAEGESPVKKTTATVYKTGAETQTSLTLKATVVGPDNLTPDHPELSWSSSKSSVAIVDQNGIVTAVGNGTAKITAAATDRSGRKATFTVKVKTDPYEIVVPKAQTVGNVDYVYVTTQGSIDVAKTIGAYTNTDASVKGVTYAATGLSKNKLTIGESGSADVTITAKGQPFSGENVSRKITLKYVSEGEIATNYSLKLEANDEVEGVVVNTNTDVTEMKMYTGLSYRVDAIAGSAEDGKIATDTTNITWISSNSKCVKVKDGVITAVKPGEADVTAEYHGVKKPIKVYVGKKYADILKSVNSSITATIKAENRDWTGVSTKFNGSNTFDLDILNPNRNILELEDIGLTTALKNIENSSVGFAQIVITDKDTDDVWTITRGVMSATIEHNGELREVASGDLREAFNEIMAESFEGSELLRAWNGKEYLLTATARDNVEFADSVKKTFDYKIEYTVKASIKDALYKRMTDDTILSQLDGLELDGLAPISYNRDNNTFAIYALDDEQDINTAYVNAKEELIARLSSVMDDVTYVNVSVDVPLKNVGTDGKATVEKQRGESELTEEYLSDLMDQYVGKLTEKAETYGELDGASAIATVKFKVGKLDYEYKYNINFVLSPEIFDRKADELIKEQTGDFEKDENISYHVEYKPEDNKLNVTFDGNYNIISELTGFGITDIVNSMIADAHAVKATVITNGKSNDVVIENDKLSTATSSILLFIGGGAETTSQLTESVVKVTYLSGTGKTTTTITYELSFKVDEKKLETTVNAVEELTLTPEETPSEEPTTTPEETPSEESTTAPEETPSEEPTTAPEETPSEEPTTTPEETPSEEPTTAPEETSAEEPDVAPAEEAVVE